MTPSSQEPDPKNMPPMDAWAQAVTLYQNNQWDEADSYCIRALEGLPGHVEARLLRGIFALTRKEYYLGLAFLSGLEQYLKPGQHVTYFINLTKAYVELGRHKEAVEAGEKALELAPDNENALINLGTAYRGMEQTDQSMEMFFKLQKLNPDNPVSDLMLGVLYQDKRREEDFATAEMYLQKAYEKDKSRPQSFLWLAGILQTRGKFDEMRQVLTECLEKFPDNSGALAMLVEDGKIALTPDQLDEAQKRSNHPETSYQERMVLNYGLSRLFHKRKQFDQAFHYLKAGNDLRQVERPYRPAQQKMFADRVVTLFTQERMQTAATGPKDPDPIFIVSMPRAGSTLLEQILSSHSRVTGVGELPVWAEVLREHDMVRQLHRADATEDELTALVDDVLQNRLPEMGQRYLERVRAEYPYDTPFVVDKMPGNVHWAGVIAKALPNAKILHIRRDWRDTCWSCYRQNFAEGQNFSYDLESARHFYFHYARIIQYWQDLFPDRILEVSYTDLIDDFETQVRRILDHCGLEFEPGCLTFHEHTRSVRTASVRQVRQPINRKGIATFTPYEPFITDWLKKDSPWDKALEQKEAVHVR